MNIDLKIPTNFHDLFGGPLNAVNCWGTNNNFTAEMFIQSPFPKGHAMNQSGVQTRKQPRGPWSPPNDLCVHTGSTVLLGATVSAPKLLKLTDVALSGLFEALQTMNVMYGL